MLSLKNSPNCSAELLLAVLDNIGKLCSGMQRIMSIFKTCPAFRLALLKIIRVLIETSGISVLYKVYRIHALIKKLLRNIIKNYRLV